MAPLVAAWRAAGGGALVWDGAGSHRARLVRAVGLPLVPRPPYAPELNPAERVIEEVRGRIEGRVDGDLEAKRAAAEAVLAELAADAGRVRRLAGWAWTRVRRRRTPRPGRGHYFTPLV